MSEKVRDRVKGMLEECEVENKKLFGFADNIFKYLSEQQNFFTEKNFLKILKSFIFLQKTLWSLNPCLRVNTFHSILTKIGLKGSKLRI